MDIMAFPKGRKSRLGSGRITVLGSNVNTKQGKVSNTGSSKKFVQSTKSKVKINNRTYLVDEEQDSENRIKKCLFRSNSTPRFIPQLNVGVDTHRLRNPFTSSTSSNSFTSDNSDPNVTGICLISETPLQLQKSNLNNKAIVKSVTKLSTVKKSGVTNSCKKMLNKCSSHSKRMPPVKSPFYSDLNSNWKSLGNLPSTSSTDSSVAIKLPNSDTNQYLRLNKQYVVRTPTPPPVRIKLYDFTSSGRVSTPELPVYSPMSGYIYKNNRIDNSNSIKTNMLGSSDGVESTNIPSQIGDKSTLIVLKNDNKTPVKINSKIVASNERSPSFMVFNNNEIEPKLDSELQSEVMSSTFTTTEKLKTQSEVGKNIQSVHKSSFVVFSDKTQSIINSNVAVQIENKSPNFIVFENDKSLPQINLDCTSKSEDSFVYNESIINCNSSSKCNNKNSTIKKKKLSMIPEADSDLNVIKKNTNVNVNLFKKSSPLSNNSFKINSVITKINDIKAELRDEKNKYNIYIENHDELIKRLIDERNFYKDRNNKIDLINTKLNELTNEIQCLIVDKENVDLNNFFELDSIKQDINYTLTDDINTNNQSNITFMLSTPKHKTNKTAMHILDDLKSDNNLRSVLKTPKPSTCKKNDFHSKAILTPHSMSLCILNQADLLFND